MDKIRNFFTKNKSAIISVLSAILTFTISISQIDMGAKVGIVVSILLVVLPLIISIIGGDDIDKTIKLLVNAIVAIQQIVKQQQQQGTDVKVVGASSKKKNILDLTEEEIKELITKEL